MINIRDGFTFDDLQLIPKYSEIESRRIEAGHIDTSVDLGKGIKLDIPIISANMKNVTESEMANLLGGLLGGLPILHRFCSIEDNVIMFKAIKAKNVGCSVGISDSEKERAEKLIEAGCKILCIDVAHGDHKRVLEVIEYYANRYKDILIIAGNVATFEGANRLYCAGADVIKVGIGPGSLCTTRIETGNGVPQMTALSDIFVRSGNKFKIISDGGIRYSGDIVKALCFSDAVMIGSMLAGTDEAPGDIIKINNILHKSYEGSSTHKVNHIEGVKAMVPCKGSAELVIKCIMEGVRSGLSYQGAKNLEELKESPKFVRVTNAGLVESHPHDVIIK